MYVSCVSRGWTRSLPDTSVISVVDDDESSRIGITTLVRSLGFTARDFQSALAFLQSPDLAGTSCVISDIQMPEMGGFELLDNLRARGNNIPIIFITAFPSDKIHAQALARGATSFLTKPFDGDALGRSLAAALKTNNQSN